MVRDFIRSAAHAVRGIEYVWQRERNFKIQTVIAALIIPVCFLLGFSIAEWIYVVIAIAAVLTGEMLNTIVEEILDVVEPHYSVHVGRLKDVTAGVVLSLSLFAITMGILAAAHHITSATSTPAAIPGNTNP